MCCVRFRGLHNTCSSLPRPRQFTFLPLFVPRSIDYILNVTREIDNFFPGLFAYHNIRVYDEETTDLLAHWNEAYHFINKAK